MFVVNQFQGAIEAQSVVIGLAGGQGTAEILWHHSPGRRVLPGPGHLRVIRTTVALLITLRNKATP